MHHEIKNIQSASFCTTLSLVEVISLRKRSKNVSIFYKKRRIGFPSLTAAFLTAVLVPGIASAGDGALTGLFFGAIGGFILAMLVVLIIPSKPLVKLGVFFPLAFMLAWPCGYFADYFFSKRIACAEQNVHLQFTLNTSVDCA
jgi:hypothetical protein